MIVDAVNLDRYDNDYEERRSDSSGVDLSSNEDEEKAVQDRRNQDYVEIKIQGLQDEVKKLKNMQVIEQKNINEIQAKINHIKLEGNIRKTGKLKKELDRTERYMSPQK